MKKKILLITLVTVAVISLLFSCAPKVRPTFSVPLLKYIVLGYFKDVFWCDPDLWPIVRPGAEEQNALTRYAAIRAADLEFKAIINHINLPEKNDYTTDEKVLIYREYKKLSGALQLAQANSTLYSFTVRTGQETGQTVTGTISINGDIKITKRENSVNTCPICLTAGTLISTPEGDIPVEKVTRGMKVWTVDCCGKQVASEIVVMASTKVPQGFEAVTIVLLDGRSVTVSTGHPTAAGIAVGSYLPGDELNGSQVKSVTSAPYAGTTYDILPALPGGLYWANGILLKSTLASK